MTAMKIHTYDHALPQSLIEDLAEKGRNTKWSFGWKSRPIGDRFSYWHHHFCGGRINETSSCLTELSARAELICLFRLWAELNTQISYLSSYYPTRVYANAHSFGNEGYIHKDSKEEENALTIVYYAHPIWAQNWGGETVFFNLQAEEVVKAIYPKPGRVAIFPGHIPHAARAPSRDATELRITFIYKLLRINI